MREGRRRGRRRSGPGPAKERARAGPCRGARCPGPPSCSSHAAVRPRPSLRAAPRTPELALQSRARAPQGLGGRGLTRTAGTPRGQRMAVGRPAYLSHPLRACGGPPTPEQRSRVQKGDATGRRPHTRLNDPPGRCRDGPGFPSLTEGRLRWAPAPPPLTFSTPSSCLGLMSTPSRGSGADCAPLSAAFISSAVITARCAVYSGSQALGASQALSAGPLCTGVRAGGHWRRQLRTGRRLEHL